MKKASIIPFLILLLSYVAFADLNSDIDYYFNMEYPNTTNMVNGSSVGTYFFALNSPNGIIGGATIYQPVGVSIRTRYELLNFPITSNPFSYSFWVNTNITGGGQVWTKSSIDYQYFYYVNGLPSAGFQPMSIGVDVFRFGSPTQHCRFSTSTIPSLNNTNWHNVIIVKRNELCNNQSFNIFVDGVLYNNFTYNNVGLTNMTYFDSKSGKWSIGSTGGSVTFQKGLLDEVGIWTNYEITQGNANTIWNNGLGNQYPFVCVEDWSASYSSCTAGDNQTLLYTDLNDCGTYDDLPLDNGTISSCNYCTASYTENIDNCVKIYTWDNYETCCAVTGIPADCPTIPENVTECVGMHTSEDIPAVAIDTIVEVGLEFIKYAGLIAIVGIGVWALYLI